MIQAQALQGRQFPVGVAVMMCDGQYGMLEVSTLIDFIKAGVDVFWFHSPPTAAGLIGKLNPAFKERIGFEDPEIDEYSVLLYLFLHLVSNYCSRRGGYYHRLNVHIYVIHFKGMLDYDLLRFTPFTVACATMYMARYVLRLYASEKLLVSRTLALYFPKLDDDEDW